MDANQALAERFQEHRIRLRAVAYRMLGSPSEADDAVQEAWLPLSGAEAKNVENPGIIVAGRSRAASSSPAHLAGSGLR
jgi:Sigma-70 region 2